MPPTVSFVRIGSQEREGRARFALLLGALLAFAVYKGVRLGLERPSELLLAIAFDSCVWTLFWWLSESIARSGKPSREWLAGALFYPALYVSAGLVFAHSWFFDAAV